MALCKRQHRYLPIFGMLPDDQKVKSGRHKCAGCAYEQGYDHGVARRSPNFLQSGLDDSQAGEVRHRSPEVAYYLGYYYGLDWWFRNH